MSHHLLCQHNCSPLPLPLCVMPKFEPHYRKLCLSQQPLQYTALDIGHTPLLQCLSQLKLPPFVHTHTHTTVLLLFWNMSGTTRVSRYQKGKTRQVKTNLDLLEQEIVSGSGICWAICKVCTSSQITTPTSHHSVFYRPDALPATQPTASKH